MNNKGSVRVQTRFVSVLTLACFGPVAVGCVSNEYVIPKQELQRLVKVPPHQRGERVYVVQDVGSRRANAVEANPETWERDTNAEVYVDGYIRIPAGHVGHAGGGHYGSGVARVAPRGGGVAQPAAGAPRRRRQLEGAGRGRRWRRRARRTWAAAAAAAGGCRRRGGGGGGGKGEALIVVAVVLVAVAAVVGVGLVASEGVRYDGPAEMWAGQPVYLKRQRRWRDWSSRSATSRRSPRRRPSRPR